MCMGGGEGTFSEKEICLVLELNVIRIPPVGNWGSHIKWNSNLGNFLATHNFIPLTFSPWRHSFSGDISWVLITVVMV